MRHNTQRSTAARGGPSLFEIAAGCLLGLFFVFPQLPLKTRYIIPLVGLLLFFRRDVIRNEMVRIVVIYTAYIITAGVAVVALFGDGSIMDALYPLRTLGLVVLTAVFVRSATVRLILFFSTAYIGISFVGVLLDYLRGPAWMLLPFPIFPEGLLDMMAARQFNSERFGGFTFESGVVGGMVAYFMLLNLALMFTGALNPRLGIRWIWQLVGAVGLMLGLAVILLAKTKSGLVVLGAGGLALAIAAILCERGATAFLRTVLVFTIAITAILVPATYTILSETSSGAYLQQERDDLVKNISGGYRGTELSGLVTRVQSARLAIDGLWHVPTGVGVTNGYIYAKKALEEVETNPEMNYYHSLGKYLGFKGYIFNMMGYGGLVAMGLWVWMLYLMYAGWKATALQGGVPVGWALVAGTIALGVAVELLPYIELLVFAALASQSLRPPESPLPSHRPLRPPLPGRPISQEDAR